MQEDKSVETESEVQEETQEDVSQEEVADEKTHEEILQEQLKACEDKLLRTHADFENIKKRLEREKASAIEYASEKFARDLLPTVDALGMAIEIENSDLDPADLLDKLKEGVELTLKQLMTALEKNGVKEVEYGELDPNIHEAVMRVDSDEVESGHIAQVMQKGYTYKDRTLRAAMVSVAN